MIGDLFCPGNFACGSVDSKNAKPCPFPAGKMGIKKGDQIATQLNECLMTELLPGFGEGALGDGSDRDFFRTQGLEEIIEFVLERTFDHIHEEEDHIGEGQKPLSDKVFGGSAVAGKKIFGYDDFVKKIDKI